MQEISKEDIKNYFDGRNFSPQIFNESETDVKDVISGIAVVQSFYGIDPERIAATNNALKSMLKSTAMPEEWIFVEGQKKESDCCFRWLVNFNIRHKFVKLTSRQDGIFMKTPLWNIGASIVKSNRLCFVDSDVSFCNSSWLREVQAKFDAGYEVLSLNGWSYYENQNEKSNIDESIGHAAEWNSDTGSSHYGFTIGMTRAIYSQFGGFPVSYILDDFEYWTALVGDGILKNKIKNWKIHSQKFDGLDVKLGSTEQVVCHCDHGYKADRKYRQLVDICRGKLDSFDEILTYNPKEPRKLPVWNTDSSFEKTVRDAILECKNSKDNDISGNDLYFKHAGKQFYQTDRLIVATCFKRKYGNSLETLRKLKSRIVDIVNMDGFVVFTDLKNVDSDIDSIPLLDYDRNLEFLQLFRKDVEFPEKSNILFVPSDMLDNLDISIICECEPRKIAISKQRFVYFKYQSDLVDKVRKAGHIGRNIDEFLYFSGFQPSKISKYIQFNNYNKD